MSPEADLPPIIRGLLNPAAYGPDVHVGSIELVETHISWVLLADDYAYKVKKPIRFGFLDFSTLELRQRYCEEELRINRRYSPELYLAVTPITGSPEQPRCPGPGPVIEYAVQMRRFPAMDLFDQRLATGRLASAHIVALAECLAHFHQSLPADRQDCIAYRCERLRQQVMDNFPLIRSQLQTVQDIIELQRLRAWTASQLEQLWPALLSRITGGQVRECHGDLHLGNIVWFAGQPKLFDGIEFDADLRWIDTMSEIAFPIMALERHGAHDLAYGFLNRYLELTGDYAGVAVLDFYRMYRAMVRAKIAILRLGQTMDAATSLRLADYRRYIAYGLALTQERRPLLLITHGFSGSGKSRLAAQLAGPMAAIRIRSDIERKRLAKGSTANGDRAVVTPELYGPAMTKRTYQRLLLTAQQLLATGQSVILDATFLRHADRLAAHAIVLDSGADFLILDVQAPIPLLKERIGQRNAEGADPSDATLAVLTNQMAWAEPLGPHELNVSITVDASDTPRLAGLLQQIGQRRNR